MERKPVAPGQHTEQFADLAGFIHHACAFTGHRPNKLPWRYNEKAPGCVALKRTLGEQIAALTDNGYTHFLSGMALGVDCWCSQIVLSPRDKSCFETLLPFALRRSGEKVARFITGTLSRHFGKGRFHRLRQPRVQRQMYAGARSCARSIFLTVVGGL